MNHIEFNFDFDLKIGVFKNLELQPEFIVVISESSPKKG